MADEGTAEQSADEPQQAAEANEQRARLVKLVATKELPRIRQRGIADLDLTAHNRKPVSCKGVEQLARIHAEKKGLEIQSRPQLIQSLLIDILTAYSGYDVASANFFSALFFNVADTSLPSNPGKLLEEARKKSGLKDDPQKFDRLRRKEFTKFSEFLADFVLDDDDSLEPLSSEAKRFWLEMQLPKGYQLESRGFRLATRVCFFLAGFLFCFLMLVMFQVRFGYDSSLEVGSASAQTYKEPSVSAAKGVILRPGESVKLKCIVQVIKHDKLAFWARIESKPWTNYYAPITAFKGGTSQAYSLLGGDVQFCSAE